MSSPRWLRGHRDVSDGARSWRVTLNSQLCVWHGQEPSPGPSPSRSEPGLPCHTAKRERDALQLPADVCGCCCSVKGRPAQAAPLQSRLRAGSVSAVPARGAQGSCSRGESAPLWVLSRAPRGAEATAPGRRGWLLMTPSGMLFSHRSRGAPEAAAGGEAAPLSSGDI